MSVLTVHLTYDRAEYIRAVRFYLRQTGMMSVWSILIFAVLAAVEGVLLWLTGLTLLNTAVIVLLVMVAAVGTFLYLVQPGRVFDKTPVFKLSYCFTFSPEDIGMQNDEAAGVMQWKYQKVWSSKEFYFLIEDKYNYTILPKRIFNGALETAQFEKIIKAAMPEVAVREFAAG